MIWKNEYDLGVEIIDTQHKELFFRVDSFLKSVNDRKPLEEKMEEIQETFRFMEEFVYIHFRDEELLQKKIEYPNYENHREVHEAFKADILNFKKEFENDKYNEALIRKFGSNLLSWLIDHFVGEDQKISKYIREKDIKI